MKKVVSLLLIIAFALTFTACTPKDGSSGSSSSSSSITSSESSESRSSSSTAAPSSQIQAAEPQGEMVYVVSKGKAYHRSPSCSNMKNPREISLQEAIKSGRTPCKNCY